MRTYYEVFATNLSWAIFPGGGLFFQSCAKQTHARHVFFFSKQYRDTRGPMQVGTLTPRSPNDSHWYTNAILLVNSMGTMEALKTVKYGNGGSRERWKHRNDVVPFDRALLKP